MIHADLLRAGDTPRASSRAGPYDYYWRPTAGSRLAGILATWEWI